MTALTYDSRSQLRGVIAAGVSATSFGVSITFATVAYAGGSDPLTVVAGTLREPLWSFLLLVTLAKGGRYLLLAGVTLGWL